MGIIPICMQLAVWEGQLETIRVMLKIIKCRSDAHIEDALNYRKSEHGGKDDRMVLPLNLNDENHWNHIVCLLLDQDGLDIDIKDGNGHTAESMAFTLSMMDMIRQRKLPE